MLLELLLRGGAGALRDLLRQVSGGEATTERPFSPEAEAEAAAAADARRDAERVAAEEARARRAAARPSAARRRARPVAPAPEPPPAGHVSSEPEPVGSFGPADTPGATLEVEPPWPNYDSHSAAEVIRRVRAGDEATRAVVLLYERTHKRRKTVIAAAETAPS